MTSTAPRKPDRALDTPALDGKRHHETLYGSLARSAWHWRLFALGLLALVIWDRLQFYFLLEEKQYVPVVIAEHEDGSTRFVGLPDPNWKPTDRQVIDDLRWLVQTMRGRTADAQFDKHLWQRAIQRATDKGQIQLAAAYQELDKTPEKGRIVIDILSINKAAEQTFDIRWQERRHDVNNALVSTSRWRGLFTVQVALPRTLQGLAQNEKGVWVDGWSIAREES